MKNSYEKEHIKVLDGIRALSIIIIAWFHFWQQNWIYYKVGNISLDFLPRYGYLLVDMMILLSSFCLFLPYAKSMVYKEKIPNTKKFYINRFARIVPSYLVSMIISIILIVILSQKIELNFFIKDTIAHLLFIHNWFSDILIKTNYMVVLWTVGLEVQFYLLYPFIAKRFIKNPYVTYFGMIIIGIIITTIIRINTTSNNIDIMVNNPLTFIMVYANGMLGAFLYVKYTKNKSRNTIKDIIFTIISIICIYIYYRLCLTIKGNLQIWQIEYRFTLSIVFITFILSTILSHKYFRIIFENRIMKFIATISFNIYIYHQFIAVKLKEFRIPYWSGNLPPNFTGDAKWQWTYFIICIIVTLIVAIIMTYLIEIPINKYIRKKLK